ncbi:PD-(D/E)XK motif protein [Brevibacillus centrosporus]|uniref:PD-(D/E)XK motif protein n=1 Tax=Brevibacillus centrosporus TaxID=54910 RepID=UPI0038279C69
MTMRMMMMLSNEILRDRWSKISFQNGGYVRIDASHPLEWHIGYEDISQKSLLLLCDYEPEPIRSSKSILFSVGERADGKWAIIFRLIRNEQEEVFIRLCCDLIESSRNQPNTIIGHKFVVNRFKQWTKLMELQGSGILSDSERKGLLGELLFLQQRLVEGVPSLDAVNSWIGPGGADQDFVYSNGWYEVKAVGLGAKMVTISSLEQLNAPLPGELVLFYIDKTAPNANNGFTLISKVAEIQNCLQHSSAASELFNKKLLQYGFINTREYEEYWYSLGGTNRYCVDWQFPRLFKGNVPHQITRASYEISIQAIENWRID